MNHPRKFLPIAWSAAAITMMLGNIGCATLIQPYPQKNLYVIPVGNPTTVPAVSGGPVLRVQVVRIAKPYDEKTFVYKTGESAFRIYYYNGFVADPGRLLTGELITWLAQSGLFTAVVGGSGVDHDLTLETNITALYGDYSVKGAPKAVLEASFVLIREQAKAYTPVFQNTYREVKPMDGGQPAQLIQAWGRAYARILEKLTADLQSVVAPPARRSDASGP
jgi:cholesterol transport system auxiliary component